MTIARRSDRGVLRYDDADTFMLDGQELVPLGGGVYRLRIEGEFRRVVLRRRLGGDRPRREAVRAREESRRPDRGHRGRERANPVLAPRARHGHRGTGSATATARTAAALRRPDRLRLYAIRFLYEGRPDAVTDRRAGSRSRLRCAARGSSTACPPTPRRSSAATHAPTRSARSAGTPRLARSAATTGQTKPRCRLCVSHTSPGRGPGTARHLRGGAAAAAARPSRPRSAGHAGGGAARRARGGRPIPRFGESGRRHLAPPQGLRTLLSALDLTDPAVALADMDGNGTADVLVLSESPLGYVRNDPGQGWTSGSGSRAPRPSTRATRTPGSSTSTATASPTSCARAQLPLRVPQPRRGGLGAAPSPSPGSTILRTSRTCPSRIRSRGHDGRRPDRRRLGARGPRRLLARPRPRPFRPARLALEPDPARASSHADSSSPTSTATGWPTSCTSTATRFASGSTAAEAPCRSAGRSASRPRRPVRTCGWPTCSARHRACSGRSRSRAATPATTSSSTSPAVCGRTCSSPSTTGSGWSPRSSTSRRLHRREPHG